jgi:hypothetical protein
VAVWRYWSQSALPVVAVVEATDAAAAVRQVMRRHGWRQAGHVAARELDGVLWYRADGVRLAPAVVHQVQPSRAEAACQLVLIDNLPL